MKGRAIVVVLALVTVGCSAQTTTDTVTTTDSTPAVSTPVVSTDTSATDTTTDTSTDSGGPCNGNPCIGDWQKEQAEGGTVVQCNDGTWSHAGGLRGACSDHGGESSVTASTDTTTTLAARLMCVSRRPA
jgi:hypothetical protein